jgi:hypothetical protein
MTVGELHRFSARQQPNAIGRLENITGVTNEPEALCPVPLHRRINHSKDT